MLTVIFMIVVLVIMFGLGLGGRGNRRPPGPDTLPPPRKENR